MVTVIIQFDFLSNTGYMTDFCFLFFPFKETLVHIFLFLKKDNRPQSVVDCFMITVFL